MLSTRRTLWAHRLLLFVFAALALPFSPRSPARAALAAPRPWVPNGSVLATAASADTLYLGGQFSYIGPPTGSLVALNPTSGAATNALPEVAGTVEVVVSDGAGGWFVGGSFTRVAGVARRALAHIRADGTLDQSWSPALDFPDNVYAIPTVYALVRSGGRLFVGGQFTHVDGQARAGLVALDSATGALDTAWAGSIPDTSYGQGVRALYSPGTRPPRQITHYLGWARCGRLRCAETRSTRAAGSIPRAAPSA